MLECESDLIKERLKKIEWWNSQNVSPYGARYLPKDSIEGLRENFEEGRTVKVAGRLMAIRGHGKTSFADLRDESGKVQLYAKKDNLGEEPFEGFRKLDVGDIVGVEGQLFTSKTGEVTIRVDRFVLLSKILQVLPEKFHGLKDVEIRYRRRYLDLIANEEVRTTFRNRSQIIKSIRKYLDNLGFMEVETPMMQSIPGGARATPFQTHHEALGVDLFLRVAPELYLKRLLVGGFEKVYEVNRNFRNEGLSPRHNPEFTMLELYYSFADLTDMMEITEGLVSALVQELHNSDKVTFGETELDFSRPWKRLGFYDAIQEKTGIDWKTADVKVEGKKLDLGLEDNASESDILNELFDKFVEPDLVNPTFVVDYPLILSPLAKQKAGDEHCADRFEMFIARMELANAFSELNDPIEQRKRFDEQRKMLGESKEIDEDFLLALEHGMPPAGGLGIGIDRLIMLLTNQHTIRDVLLFPQMRPEKGA